MRYYQEVSLVNIIGDQMFGSSLVPFIDECSFHQGCSGRRLPIIDAGQSTDVGTQAVGESDNVSLK